jgi:CRP-like cAMP-binding protein/tRNA A-37 threonylcarbamoyl transferase component Bud32
LFLYLLFTNSFTTWKGAYLGERALLTDEPRVGNAVAEVDRTVVLCIPMADFVQMLGPYKELALKSNDVKILKGIPTFSKSTLSSTEMAELSHRIEPDTTINEPGTTVYERDMPMSPAIYIVRSGSVKLKKGDVDDSLISAGGYFGLESIFYDGDNVIATMTAVAQDTPLIIAKLTLASILSVAVDRARLYRPDSSVDLHAKRAQDAKLMRKSEMLKPLSLSALGERDSIQINHLDDLVKHRILGRGTFGRVWLVTAKHNTPKATSKTYALKVQYKRELLSHRQDAGVIREKQIMESLDHPFIIRLVSSFQDETCVYMLLSLIQGGELYALMDDGRKLPEKSHAKFFSAAILESLGYLHHRSILYRDLKPENVLIGVDGYPVLVDLGFAKIVKDKTYTLCGTPLYLAPEVILSRGHDKGCDYWSWAGTVTL